VRVGFWSDTHMKHSEVTVPFCDVLVHCGDFTSHGDLSEVKEFCDYVSAIDCTYKIAVAGNHDFCFEDKELSGEAEQLLKDSGIIYLNDSGVEIEGFKFWGSPIQPTFFNWAFNRERGSVIKKHWDLIPLDTDVLITHGPPFGILDKTRYGDSVGCEDLLNRVTKVKPLVHAFGHIHESYGETIVDSISYINASAVKAVPGGGVNNIILKEVGHR
jgi:Icc-related predicted phosphoesterase